MRADFSGSRDKVISWMARGKRRVAWYHRDYEHRLQSLIQALCITNPANSGNFFYLSELHFSCLCKGDVNSPWLMGLL